MDEETTQALLELDEAIDSVKASLQKCGALVNAGRLDGNVILLKFAELQAELMGGVGA